MFFFFNDTATTEIYPLPLHDALPICREIEERHRSGNVVDRRVPEALAVLGDEKYAALEDIDADDRARRGAGPSGVGEGRAVEGLLGVAAIDPELLGLEIRGLPAVREEARRQ